MTISYWIKYEHHREPLLCKAGSWEEFMHRFLHIAILIQPQYGKVEWMVQSYD